MERQKIGTVELKYNEKGELESSKFTPEPIIMGVKKDQLYIEAISKTDEVEKIKALADISFSSWFNNISEIEISDKKEFEIVSEVSLCEKLDTNTVKFCRIDYFHQEIV